MTLKTKSSLCNGLSTISAIFPYRWEMKGEMNSSDLCLKPSSSLLDTSTTVLNGNCHKTPELGHPMSCLVRTPKMWTSAGLHHSEIKETQWSSVTRLTHGPSSQYCRVANKCRDNQRPCTSQCQASWTRLVDWQLVYYQDRPKSMNHQIISTPWYATQYDLYMHEHPQGLRSRLQQVRQPQKDHVTYMVRLVALSNQVVVVDVAVNHKASHLKLQTVYSTDCLSLVWDWPRPPE